MNIFDRIILAVYMLLMALVALCIIILPFHLIPRDMIDLIFDELYSKWYYALIGLVLLAVSLKLMLSGMRSKNRAKKGIVKSSELGDIRISIDTFEALALRAVKHISGIKDVKIRALMSGNELIMRIKLFVHPDVNIPKVVGEVQGSVKGYVESITEVDVREVRVAVDNVAAASAAARVE